VGAPERIYRNSVRAFSVIFLILGAAILATTVANGGGPVSLGFWLGLAFLVVGAARLWMARG